MNGTVLIVNDDVNGRIIEETLLQARGLPVRSVGDGGDACDLLRRDGARIGLVQVLVDGERWMVRGLGGHTVSCGNCGRTPEPACYSAADERATYCATCVFARDVQEAHP